MGQPEKRLLWHPRHDNKFLVGGGSQITLYEWAPDFPEIRQVTSRHDLLHMKCFAWSPDPAFDDLIAVGQGTGKIDLFRLEASKYANRNNVLSTGPTTTLPVRNSRSCNSVAFCNVDTNYLAVGLDKVRGDCSLLIWDIATTSPILSIVSDSQHQRLDPDAHNHIQIQPALGTRRPQPQIYRGDVGPRVDPRVLQQHAPTETVSSVCFLPQSTHLLLAGISSRWLRLFDLRSPVLSMTNVASKVQGIVTDPFDPHRIACFGDSMITVWDARKLPHPLLSFTECDAAADGARPRAEQNGGYGGIEFSSTRRGMLASLEKDASIVRFWDMVGVQPPMYTFDGAVLDESKTREVGKVGRRSWANLPWPAGQHQTPPSPKEQSEAALASVVLHDTRRTKAFTRALASFALVPNTGTNSHPLTSNVMVVNKDGDLELYAVHDTPKQAMWSARGDLAILAGQTCRVIEGFSESSLARRIDPLSDLSHSNSQSREVESLPTTNSTHAASKSRHRTMTDPVIPPPPAPLFGRGYEEGFPALGFGSGSGNSMRVVDWRGRKGTAFGNTLDWRAKRDSGGSAVGAENIITTASAPASATVTTARGSMSGLRNRRSGDRLEAEVGSRSHSMSRGRKMGRGFSRVVEDDISMLMRRRALKGYGLSKPQNNILIVQNDYDPLHGQLDLLADLWAWICHWREFLNTPTPLVHGYDFSHQGLLGIWEGNIPTVPISQSDPLPNPTNNSYHDRRSSRHADEMHSGSGGNFQAALSVLAARRLGASDMRTWKSGVATMKGVQRQIALVLCGWSLRDEEMMGTIKKWEKNGEISRAACWLVLLKQYTKAIDLLMRSDDEAHRMMSGTVAALVPHLSSSKSTELREHCGRLIVGMQDPYFRALLTHLALNDWSEILDEETLPFRERLAIAFLFLDDKAVTVYLRRCMDRAVTGGTVDGVMVPGLASRMGLEILQSYVDRTGDVQSAAMLGSYVCPPGKVGRLGSWGSARVGRWVESYRDLLDGFRMFYCRVGFDIERGQLALGEGMSGADNADGVGWVPRQIMIRCNYCNKPISGDGADASDRATIELRQQKEKPTLCPHCSRMLPRCSLCLQTLSVASDATRDAELLQSQYKDTMDEAIVVCQTCRHGGHASHIIDWFFGEDGVQLHDVCAVADCDCRCADEM